MPAPVRIARAFGTVNCWLVEEDDDLTLVDTNLTGSAESILQAAGRTGKQIARIVLTHSHFDHVGSLDALAERLPGVEVMVGAREARLLARDMSLDAGEPSNSLMRSTYPGARTQPTATLAEGDRVGSLEAVASPGHTPGHLAFIDTRDRSLYCGDAYAAMGAVETCARLNPRWPLTWLGTWNKPTGLESARKLRALEPSALAPGHGKLVQDPVAAMDAAIKRAG
jgi:glyoxylase-like metal-dependent hydrolase (beta-lactamase superfamily II)